jgi:hypothetical protein
MKLEFSRPILEKYSISNFIKIRDVKAELFHVEGQTHRRMDGRTDRHDEDDGNFSQFYERA